MHSQYQYIAAKPSIAPHQATNNPQTHLYLPWIGSGMIPASALIHKHNHGICVSSWLKGKDRANDISFFFFPECSANKQVEEVTERKKTHRAQPIHRNMSHPLRSLFTLASHPWNECNIFSHANLHPHRTIEHASILISFPSLPSSSTLSLIQETNVATRILASRSLLQIFPCQNFSLHKERRDAT